MKYIDADKLIAEIERRYHKAVDESKYMNSAKFVRNELENLREFAYSLQQEKPEMDLEKFTEKIKTFQARYKYPESISIKGAMAFMARMFYQYPNVARKWYDSMPKATMD